MMAMVKAAEKRAGSSFHLSTGRCSSYEPERVQQALIALLAPLGGIAAFVRAGQTVLLKPNMLSNKRPEEAITTHPAIVESVVRLCQAQGARVFIGDSPPLALGKIEDYWATTGFKKVADATGATLLSFEKEPRREITLSVGHQPLKIHVSEWYFRADVVINLPKMKTHNLTVLTGAVKNHFGLLPGVQKPQLHMKFTRPFDFGEMMAEIATAIPMHLTIMDGITGMDGQGPAGGRVIMPGLLFASQHPVVTDWGFCRVAGQDPKNLPVLDRCHAMGFGPAHYDEIQVSGPALDELKFAGFNAPHQAFAWNRLPEVCLKIMRRLVWVRPLIDSEKCVQCQACSRVCPARAILIDSHEQSISRRRCVSCFCCTEVCPKKAIVTQGSGLLELGMKIRRLKHFLQGRKNDL